MEKLRKAANEIDNDDSPYKAVVSVLMLREGWDVRNITTIVGLRPFNAYSKILPEQAIGRGLRKMFGIESKGKKLFVIGTPAFLEFVESLKTEGVEFQYSPMGKGSKGKTPVIIEVDKDNPNKIIGDNPFELEFASFLENRFNDVIAFAKNTTGECGINFKIEYQAENGNIG